MQARKSHPLAGSEERKVRPLSQIVCAKCKKEGHKAKETSTGRQYDWSEGGVFDFSDSLFISSLLFQFVLPIDCARVDFRDAHAVICGEGSLKI